MIKDESIFQNDLENDEVLKFDTKKSKVYKVEQSSSSFSFDDLVGFTFGPVNSRFWMLRKQILDMDKSDLMEGEPFYAWDCITLQIRGKPDIYLVIKNEKIMKMFIKLLIYKMRTIDGKRNTMDRCIELIMSDKLKKKP